MLISSALYESTTTESRIGPCRRTLARSEQGPEWTASTAAARGAAAGAAGRRAARRRAGRRARLCRNPCCMRLANGAHARSRRSRVSRRRRRRTGGDRFVEEEPSKGDDDDCQIGRGGGSLRARRTSVRSMPRKQTFGSHRHFVHMSVTPFFAVFSCSAGIP